MLRRGDTFCIMLEYQVNGEDLVEGAYQEIELQINYDKSAKNSIKKLLSANDITWETVTYKDEIDGTEKTFTGYVVHLNQDETFMLSSGNSTCQLRIKMDDEVGSSETSDFKLGDTLSSKVL